MFKDDNGKEILTKESIRDKMLQREKIKLVVTPILFLLLLFGWALVISMDNYYSGPCYALMGTISAYVILLSYSVIKNAIVLTRLAFTIDEDSVYINDYSSVPYHKRPGKYELYGVINFCKYDWVPVDIDNYSYTNIGDEFYLVVVGTKKKKAIWGYNKRFYDYKG